MTQFKTHNGFTKSFDGLLHELFSEMPATIGKTMREDVFSFPPVNITEKTDSYQLDVAAPGWDKADFSIKLDGKILTISAEKKQEMKEEADKIIRREFTYKGFKRSFTLDDKIDAGSIVAKYENGILKLTLAKREDVKAGVKDITIL